MSACAICAEPFTAALRRPVACPHCGRSGCLQCSHKFLLMFASSPKCAFCNKAWTSDIVESMFSKAFRRGPLRQQAIQNLIHQERSLIPDTLAKIDERQRREKYTALWHKMQNILKLWLRQPTEDPSFETMTQVVDLRHNMRNLGFTGDPRATVRHARQQAVKRIVKCPSTGCEGFLNAANNCPLCKCSVCRECNKALAGAEHQCNPDDVASWALIKEECKSCPKCATPIYKISGCSQMWCVVPGCNTAFDWNTGHVVSGPVHNPHYHQWLANGGAAVAGDRGGLNVDCNGIQLIQHQDLYDLYQTLRGAISQALYTEVSQWLRALQEVHVMRAPPEPYGPTTYEQLREAFVTKRISANEWASSLSHKETLRTKAMRMRQVQEMFAVASNDLVARLINDLRAKVGLDQRVRNCVTALEDLRRYFVKSQLAVLADYADTSLRTLVWRSFATGPLNLIWDRVTCKFAEDSTRNYAAGSLYASATHDGGSGKNQ